MCVTSRRSWLLLGAPMLLGLREPRMLQRRTFARGLISIPAFSLSLLLSLQCEDFTLKKFNTKRPFLKEFYF